MRSRGTADMRTIRTYSELILINSFLERYRYLRLQGTVGEATFGFDRYLNQRFYHSKEWREIRDFIIVRDTGCDLGMLDHEIKGAIYIHHMNPMLPEDLRRITASILDPEYLICTSCRTHSAIHYGDESLLDLGFVERTPFDTCPWRKNEKGISR